MVKMRKIGLALLIFGVLLFGIVGGFFACTYMESSFGRVILSENDYNTLSILAQKYAKAEALKNHIKENYYQPVDDEALETGIYKGLFEALEDPYSSYLTPLEYENMTVSSSGDYCGVGITLSLTDDERFVCAIALTEGAPSWDSGIQVGDIIWKVDGVAFTGKELDKCASAVRGEAGTDVTLTIIRDEQAIDFTLTRARIIAKTVSYKMLEDNIGYIAISSFEDPTYNDFANALYSLEQDGARGLIIDLRNNGGGYVDSAVSIADELMDEATLVYTEDQNGERQYYTTKAGRTNLPYVLLINQATASASEILAAGVQDNKEGEIIGTTSYGKGIIQAVQGLSDGSAIKMTISQYFSPNGKVIHKKGITPDYIVELPEECYDENYKLIYDKQLDKALQIIKINIKEKEK